MTANKKSVPWPKGLDSIDRAILEMVATLPEEWVKRKPLIRTSAEDTAATMLLTSGFAELKRSYSYSANGSMLKVVLVFVRGVTNEAMGSKMRAILLSKCPEWMGPNGEPKARVSSASGPQWIRLSSEGAKMRHKFIGTAPGAICEMVHEQQALLPRFQWPVDAAVRVESCVYVANPAPDLPTDQAYQPASYFGPTIAARIRMRICRGNSGIRYQGDGKQRRYHLEDVRRLYMKDLAAREDQMKLESAAILTKDDSNRKRELSRKQVDRSSA